MNERKSEIQTLKPRSNLACREIRGQVVAVDMDSGDYHVFNEVGAFIWQRIMADKDSASIVEDIITAYRVTRERAANDFDGFVTRLKTNCLLD